MDKEKLRKRLMETFLGELEDRLQSMSRELLALEQKGSAASERARLIPSLLRHAHSLKGAARAVDTRLIEEACHRFEDILGSVQKDPELLNADVFQLLFGTIDGLEEAKGRLRGDQALEGGLLEGISLEMEMYIENMLPNARTAAAKPGPSQNEEAPTEDAGPPPESEFDFAAALDPEQPQASEDPAAAAAPAPGGQALAEGLSVRIDTEKLDLLLPRSGELLVARQRLRGTADRLGALRDGIDRLHADWRLAKALLARLQNSQPGAAGQTIALPGRISELCENTPARLSALEAELEQTQIAFTADWRLLDQAAVSLDEHVRRIRMLPFAHGCVGFDRLVRDLSRESGKETELQIEGGEVEIDRSILEGLKDPLRHLIRNAVDHGIEKPNERRQVGKSPCGRIRASAAVRGGQVVVTVSDDGRGLAVDAIRKRAKKMGLPVPEHERDIIQVMFMPGFSTAADAVTMVSGRGIGLDAVKTEIKGLHGEIDVSFAPGQGTRFQISLPLTLTMLRALLVTVGKQIYAISSAHVAKLLRIQPSDVMVVGERPMIVLNGKTIPLLMLADVLRLPQTDKTQQAQTSAKQPVVVVSMEDRQVAFVVDEILAEQEVMVKSLGNRIQRIPNIAGALILPSGQVALTLHIADLVHSAGTQLHTAMQATSPHPFQSETPEKGRRARRILVVDDSVTTRSLEKSILEAAGFSVDVAKDGQEGWERVQAGDFDLVLSDVDMPRMIGYQMIETIRRSERFRKLPVILITSHDDTKSKERAMRAGASGYIVKGEFDQKVLLQLIEQLI